MSGVSQDFQQENNNLPHLVLLTSYNDISQAMLQSTEFTKMNNNPLLSNSKLWKQSSIKESHSLIDQSSLCSYDSPEQNLDDEVDMSIADESTTTKMESPQPRIQMIP